MIHLNKLDEAFSSFKNANPFNHCVINDFLHTEVLEHIQREFLSFESERWHVYNNAIENKKTLNDWNMFPKNTYQLFNYMNSTVVLDKLSELIKMPLYADPGLHGGGWHAHGPGGNLNPHLDYSIHPKLGRQRKLNIIIYISPTLTEQHGGHLGLWKHDSQTNQPGELVKEIAPQCNRAVLFDTTQNSWHGMSRTLEVPPGIYRQSLAIYYLCDPEEGTDSRQRALFAPRDIQKGDKNIEELIALRANVETSHKVYRPK